jgi:ribosomal protein S18 acetylase RimI-like enzyme
LEFAFRADPSKKLIQDYLQAGMLFAWSKDGHPIAVMVLQELSPDKLEIKNIAVDPRFENRGIATKAIAGCRSLCKGTSLSTIANWHWEYEL